jgi:hypothetical protein
MCDKCYQSGFNTPEEFTLEGEFGKYVWDVTSASRMIHPGRKTYNIPSSVVRSLLVHAKIEPLHTRHVDPTKPGILAKIGTRVALIDGAHRALRCLEENRPFTAYLLSSRESEACMVKRPGFRTRHPAA